MSATTEALVLEAPRRLVRRELPLATCGDDDAMLRVEACGLCGTDHEQYTGDLPTTFAFVPGHETVGTIETIGATASKRWGVREGDRVAIEVFQSCHECAPCRAGEYRRCVRHGLGDIYGYVPLDRAPGPWGGYARQHYLSADTMLHRVPDGLDAVVATLFNPLGAGIRWAATMPATGAGDVVAVLGPGIRGLCSAAAAKEAGAAFVMVTGVGPRDDARLAIANKFGADLTVDVSTDDAVAALHAATGGLADIVVDVTAKAPGAFAQAVALARPGGTIVMAGTRGVPGTPGLHPDLIVYKELRILGALGVDAPAYAAALDLLASGRFPFASLPRRTVSLDDAEALVISMAGEGDAPPVVHGVIVP